MTVRLAHGGIVDYIAIVQLPTDNACRTKLRAVVFDDPHDLIYSDEINQIGYMLNLPERWEYWVPIRNVVTVQEREQKRKDRLLHTMRVGQCVLELGYSYDTASINLLQRITAIRLSIASNVCSEITQYIDGALQMSRLSGFKSPDSGGIYHCGGILWDDMLHAMRTLSSDTLFGDIETNGELPTQTQEIERFVADMVEYVPNDPVVIMEGIMTIYRVFFERIIATYPEDVDPAVLGLPLADNGNTTAGPARNLNEDIGSNQFVRRIMKMGWRGVPMPSTQATSSNNQPDGVLSTRDSSQLAIALRRRLGLFVTRRICSSLSHWLTRQNPANNQQYNDVALLVGELQVVIKISADDFSRHHGHECRPWGHFEVDPASERKHIMPVRYD